MAKYTIQTHYNWQQNGWNYQAGLYVEAFPSKYQVLIRHTQACKCWRKFARGMHSIRSQFLQRDAKATYGKPDLDAIIRRSTYFIEHCQRRADEQYPRRRTVHSNHTNGKPQLVTTTDAIGMATKAGTWTSSFHRWKWK